MLLARVQAHWRTKVGLTVGANLLFWAGYAFLGRNAFFPLRLPPVTWLDRAIPFQPEPWAWLYLSQFLISGALPWLITTREGLRRYAVGLAVLCGVSFACFFLFPVASPRASDADPSPAMALILRYDGAMNAFPSLHAGFLAYLGLLGWRLFRPSLSTAAIFAALVWGAAILYATIATRQHYVVDLLAGGGVGVLADWVAWRGAEASAAATISRSNGVAFHDGVR